MSFGPIVPPRGPSPARIAIVGEFPTEAESQSLLPIAGLPGRELRKMLSTVGIDLDSCFVTNVFSRQPYGDNLALYGVEAKDASAHSRSLGPLTTAPITYIADEHLPEIERLLSELDACKPNVIIALGPVAAWALLNQRELTQLRGSVHSTLLACGAVKVLPTYHPSAILRQWDWRVIALADLEKAHVESAYPDFIYDNMELWLEPSLADLTHFGDTYLASATHIATDVETKRGQITCVSFAPSPQISICVPFWCDGPEPSYWPTAGDESVAWEWCRRWLEDPSITKVLQNGLYDTQYFRAHGIALRGFTEDTMLLHHSKYSELRKGLGFLGSVYANVPSWKHMRVGRFEEELKRDD